ncbi:hypothetical protein GCM10027346_01640 [Hymenobacter seoulensis]
MPAIQSSLPTSLSPETAVLLVLLPPAVRAEGHSPAGIALLLASLQQRLGTAVRVLRIDEASHPTVVQSFQAVELPSFVLVQRGVELWRQRGLPEGDVVAELLLSKLVAPA